MLGETTNTAQSLSARHAAQHMAFVACGIVFSVMLLGIVFSVMLLLYEDQPRLFSTLCMHWKLRAKCGCAWVTRMWKLIWPLISSLIVFPIDSNSVLTCQIVRHGLVATSLETRTVTPPSGAGNEDNNDDAGADNSPKRAETRSMSKINRFNPTGNNRRSTRHQKSQPSGRTSANGKR